MCLALCECASPRVMCCAPRPSARPARMGVAYRETGGGGGWACAESGGGRRQAHPAAALPACPPCSWPHFAARLT
eukprot:6771515-Prymnesium_polylepis.1